MLKWLPLDATSGHARRVRRYHAGMYWDLNEAAWRLADAEPAQSDEQADESRATEPELEPAQELELT